MVDKKTKNPGIIPASELSGVSVWELPEVDSPHVVRSPFDQKEQAEAGQATVEVIEAEPLTVEAIEQIRQQAEKEARKQGYDEGLAQGRTKGEGLGYTAGYKQGERDINALKARLGDLISGLDQPYQRQQQELESALLRMVIDTAQVLVKKELSSHSELLSQTLHEALQALPHGEHGLHLTVHPDDQSLLEEFREREHGNWVVATNDEMSPGGVVIKGVNSYLDYSVEKRFQHVAEQWLNQRDDLHAESGLPEQISADVDQPSKDSKA